MVLEYFFPHSPCHLVYHVIITIIHQFLEQVWKLCRLCHDPSLLNNASSCSKLFISDVCDDHVDDHYWHSNIQVLVKNPSGHPSSHDGEVQPGASNISLGQSTFNGSTKLDTLTPFNP